MKVIEIAEGYLEKYEVFPMEEEIIKNLLAECKRQRDRIPQLQQDNHRLHKHELLLDAEVKRLEAFHKGHCKDCCCAQSWKALGITKYTGKSIPEEIEALKERAEKAEEQMVAANHRATDLQYQLTDMGAEAARWQAVAESLTAKDMAKKLYCRYDGMMICDYGDDGWCVDCSQKRTIQKQAAAALGQPRAWLITEERWTALDTAIILLDTAIRENGDNCTLETTGLRTDHKVLSAMQAEAKQ